MKPSRWKAALIISTVLTGLHAAHADDLKVGDLVVEQPHAKAMLPGAKVGGAYLTIENKGQVQDRLVSVSSERAKSVQIHDMKVDNGVMIMREVKEGLAIAPGGSLEMKPGGYHLMFTGVSKAFKQGEIVKATLVFEKAGSLTVDIPVGSASGG